MTADIKDGFLHVLVAREHRDYLEFSYKGVYYRRKVLPFGFCCSLYYFAMVTYLRSFGLLVTMYVDDSLLAVEEACAIDHIDQLIKNLTELGFKVNFEKSKLVALSKTSYIG